MKSLIYILMATCFACSCNLNHKPQKDEVKERIGISNSTDTVVTYITISGDAEREYFLRIQNDTSRFSLYVDLNSSGNIVAKYGLGSIRNITNYAGDSLALKDDMGPINNPMIKNYGQQIVELEYLFNAAAKDFKLQKLYHIRLSIGAIYGLSENITEEYVVKYGTNFNSKSNQNICTLIKESVFVSDLNRILTKYNLIIDRLSIDGLVYNTNKETTQKSLDGLLIITFKKN